MYEKLRPLLDIKKEESSSLKRLRLLEEEIQDLKLCLVGSSASRAWQEINMKLMNLQSDRKYRLWEIYGPERYPNNRKENTGAPPTNLSEQIPDL